MTPSETTALIDKHLANWLGSGAAPEGPGFTLRDRIAAMIAEAIAGRDKLWSDGAETLRHERDEAIAARTVLKKEVRVLMDQRAAISAARDDAIHAAHLIAEELAQAKAEIERYENEPHK